VIEQQHRPGGVGLDALLVDLWLDVQDDAFVAEADPKVLQAAVAAARLRQLVTDLIPMREAACPVDDHTAASRRRARRSSSSTHQCTSAC
jgi:hypothetical protein